MSSITLYSTKDELLALYWKIVRELEKECPFEFGTNEFFDWIDEQLKSKEIL